MNDLERSLTTSPYKTYKLPSRIYQHSHSGIEEEKIYRYITIIRNVCGNMTTLIASYFTNYPLDKHFAYGIPIP